jgi:hypothetical protein
MASKKKLLQAAAGSAGGAGLDVDDVFSGYLYNGNSSTQTITNGIDLSGEGGLVWIKMRNDAYGNSLYDTARGVNKRLRTEETSGESTRTADVTAFTSSGFTMGSNGAINGSAYNFVSWTFRKAPKFFDVVTYTGNGTSGRQISHNLGSDIGMVIVKNRDDTNGWAVKHRSVSGSEGQLHSSVAFAGYGNFPTSSDSGFSSTYFTVTSGGGTNTNGDNYIAYVFAHNNNDGNFGPAGDQDIIKCGTFGGSNSGGNLVNLGFNPEFVMFKRYDGTGGSWFMCDQRRGFTSKPNINGEVATLKADTSDDESSLQFQIGLDSQGFREDGLGAGANYIYMAIRRGPLTTPEDATKFFAVDQGSSVNNNEQAFDAGFPVDLLIRKDPTQTYDFLVLDRIRGHSDFLKTNTSNAEATTAYANQFDSSTGIFSDTAFNFSAHYAWMWRRAPSYFDVVAYLGNDTAGRTVSHNLGAVPEMMWTKRRNSTGGDWDVYHKDIGNTKYLTLNSSAAASTSQYTWNNTTPTESVFTIGTGANNTNGDNFIAYLFASVPNVSFVGSYTGNGSSSGPTVDCGFSSGARFVLIKRTAAAGSWAVFDTARGINSGNDPYLFLNSNGAETTSLDIIDPHSSGFSISSHEDFVNADGETFIFYAIA